MPLAGCGPSEDEKLKKAADECIDIIRTHYSWKYPETLRVESFKKIVYELNKDELEVVVMAQNGFGNFLPSSKTCILADDNTFDSVATMSAFDKDPESIGARARASMEVLDKILSEEKDRK